MCSVEQASYPIASLRAGGRALRGYGALIAWAREMGHGDFADIGDDETTLGPALTWIRAGMPRSTTARCSERPAGGA